MIGFLNNGGLEMLLATGYLLYILILAKLEDDRICRKDKNEKWHW